jgi:hypothetical protein
MSGMVLEEGIREESCLDVGITVMEEMYSIGGGGLRDYDHVLH